MLNAWVKVFLDDKRTDYFLKQALITNIDETRNETRKYTVDYLSKEDTKLFARWAGKKRLIYNVAMQHFTSVCPANFCIKNDY